MLDLNTDFHGAKTRRSDRLERRLATGKGRKGLFLVWRAKYYYSVKVMHERACSRNGCLRLFCTSTQHEQLRVYYFIERGSDGSYPLLHADTAYN